MSPSTTWRWTHWRSSIPTAGSTATSGHRCGQIRREIASYDQRPRTPRLDEARARGRSLISWAIDRSHARLGQHGDPLPKIIRAYAYEEDVATVRVYESCGFGRDRYFVELMLDLTTPIRSANIAEGVVVTPWTSAVNDATHTAHNEAFADHWGSEPITEERWRRWLSHNEAFLPDASFVACVGDAIVGYSMNRATPRSGKISDTPKAGSTHWGTARTRRKQSSDRS